MTLSEVEDVTGHIGNFRVKVRKKARYVNENECTACAECVDICPVIMPDEYQMGFSSRKAIYIPFPQAVPSSYVINMEECLGNNPIACGKCLEKCDKSCSYLSGNLHRISDSRSPSYRIRFQLAWFG